MPLMDDSISYVSLTVSTVGVPLIVHVLLSMDRPVGRFGEAVQEVAPVTLVVPPPEPLLEPLFTPVLESQVLLPETATGEFWLVLDPPSPNCPFWSFPQHFMSPLSRMAQVWEIPSLTATAVRPVPRSIAVEEGALRSVLTPPLPKYPCPSDPQHFRSPLSRMAQVTMTARPTTATAVRPVPRSIAVEEGALRSVAVPPSPNCP